jgi:predicted aspartyl protease
MKLGLVILALSLAPALPGQQPPTVPFRLYDGWAIVLEGTLVGVPNCKIMIDTGAVPSAINIRFAKRLGLSGSPQKLSAMNRSIEAQRLRVPDVRIGPVSADALDMMAVDLGRIEQRLNTRIDGIVGLDFLAQRNFRIDYRRKKLIFVGTVDDAVPTTFEIRHEAGGIYVLIPLKGSSQQLRVLLDTGSKDLTLFDQRVDRKQQGFRILGRDAQVSVGGQDPLVVVEVDTVSVGAILRRNQKANVLVTSDEQLRDFDGVLGPAALGITAVAFDFSRHIVSFETH